MNKLSIATHYKNDVYKFSKSTLNYGVAWHNFIISSVYSKMTNFRNPNERRKEMSYYNYEEFKKIYL